MSMGSLYRKDEIKAVLDDMIHEMMEKLLANPEINAAADGEVLGRIRICRQFADDVVRTITRIDEEYTAELNKYVQVKAGEMSGTAT